MTHARFRFPALDRPDAPDEMALVAQIRRGDQAAFERLFRRYFETLARFACAYVDSRAIADELVQDVFLRIWTGRARWDVRGSPKTYLFSAVRHHAVDYCRHATVERRHEAEAVRDAVSFAMGSPPVASDVQMAERERLAALARAVQRLPEQRRTVLLLRWEYDMTYSEIAATLGITVRAAEMAAHRAMNALRQELPKTE